MQQHHHEQKDDWSFVSELSISEQQIVIKHMLSKQEKYEERKNKQKEHFVSFVPP